jgi:hypothetical protein
VSVPTRGETYARFIEHLRLAQEDAAMMAHLHNTESRDGHIAQGWLAISELIKRMQSQVTKLAMRGLQ